LDSKQAKIDGTTSHSNNNIGDNARQIQGTILQQIRRQQQTKRTQHGRRVKKEKKIFSYDANLFNQPIAQRKKKSGHVACEDEYGLKHVQHHPLALEGLELLHKDVEHVAPVASSSGKAQRVAVVDFEHNTDEHGRGWESVASKDGDLRCLVGQGMCLVVEVEAYTLRGEAFDPCFAMDTYHWVGA